jgi:NTP pyrophosphatase (non-canonical NTP hydrolase)
MDSPKTTTLAVRTFAMGTDKEAALKPLEEASEVRAAWQEVMRACDESMLNNGCCTPNFSIPCTEANHCALMQNLADEIADCIQACANLAARYGIDLQAAMDRCHERNHERGRC